MTILDAKSEEQAVHNTTNWLDREELAYPEDAPIMQQLRDYVPEEKRDFSKSQIKNFQKHYARCGHKPTTMREFDITKEELDRALKYVR
jgi:hypothetical protein